MSCIAGTFHVHTTNTSAPGWGGTLVVTSDGDNSTFTPKGGQPGDVKVHCGKHKDSGLAFISFTDKNVKPPVKYMEATQKAGVEKLEFVGRVEEESSVYAHPPESAETWTAEAQNDHGDHDRKH